MTTHILHGVPNNLDLFETNELQFKQLDDKKYEITEDLLTLSCAWYRIRKNKGNHVSPSISNLLQKELFTYVAKEDRALADQIRDYYNKKFMVMVLKDQRLTTFRRALQNYLIGDARKFVESTIPMIYRLPEFYVNDIKFDLIQHDFEKVIPNPTNHTRRTQLIPVDSLYKNNKLGKTIEYWLKDEHNYAYRFSLLTTNPLLGLWNNIFTNDSVTLTISVGKTRRDNLQFFDILSILGD